jgi:hypothetical protein
MGINVSSIQVREASLGGFPIHELAAIVPLADTAEQATLMYSISIAGQSLPIILWKGAVVDGRCRQKALTALNYDIMYTELPDTATEAEVRSYVMSVNTRRNLTNSQKIAIACKQYLSNKDKTTIVAAAKEWGVGEMTLKNALWIHKQDPAVIETIFNGGTITIGDKDGKAVLTNKITAIYAYMKKQQENVQVVDNGWQAGTYIKTQAGKEWYYEQLKQVGEVTPYTRMLIAELANFKFVAVSSEI